MLFRDWPGHHVVVFRNVDSTGGTSSTPLVSIYLNGHLEEQVATALDNRKLFDAIMMLMLPEVQKACIQACMDQTRAATLSFLDSEAFCGPMRKWTGNSIRAHEASFHNLPPVQDGGGGDERLPDSDDTSSIGPGSLGHRVDL
jgi:hypothetical protein